MRRNSILKIANYAIAVALALCMNACSSQDDGIEEPKSETDSTYSTLNGPMCGKPISFEEACALGLTLIPVSDPDFNAPVLPDSVVEITLTDDKPETVELESPASVYGFFTSKDISTFGAPYMVRKPLSWVFYRVNQDYGPIHVLQTEPLKLTITKKKGAEMSPINIRVGRVLLFVATDIDNPAPNPHEVYSTIRVK